MSLYDVVKAQFDAIIDEVKLSVSDKKLSLQEAWKIAQLSISSFVKIVEEVRIVDGPTKKAAVMVAAAQLYDILSKVVKIPYVPTFLQSFLAKYGKSLYLSIVSGSIDAIVDIFWDNGIFVDKKEV